MPDFSLLCKVSRLIFFALGGSRRTHNPSLQDPNSCGPTNVFNKLRSIRIALCLLRLRLGCKENYDDQADSTSQAWIGSNRNAGLRDTGWLFDYYQQGAEGIEREHPLRPNSDTLKDTSQHNGAFCGTAPHCGLDFPPTTEISEAWKGRVPQVNTRK
jgi:hypothetical protein